MIKVAGDVKKACHRTHIEPRRRPPNYCCLFLRRRVARVKTAPPHPLPALRAKSPTAVLTVSLISSFLVFFSDRFTRGQNNEQEQQKNHHGSRHA